MAKRRPTEMVTFGPWRLNRESGELTHRGQSRRLPGKIQTLLELFLGQPGRLLSRDELKRELWPSGTHVDYDNNLNTSLARLREILEDRGPTPRYIETVPRKGYRWIGPPAVWHPSHPRRPRRLVWAAALLAAPLLIGSVWLARSARPQAPPAALRIAVVPFEVLERDDLDYLAQGLTWQVVTELVNWNPARLEVLGQESAARLEKDPESVAAAALDYVLRGAVQTDHRGRLNISARLERTADRVTVWAQRFVREESADPALQRQIALNVTRSLGLRLSRRSTFDSPADPTARNALLRARYLLNKKETGSDRQRDLEEAVRQVEQALSSAPDSVEALLLASDIAMSLTPGRTESVDRAHAYLARALSLAPDHPETLIRRAGYLFNLHWDFERAEKDFRRALALNPGESSYHASYAFFLSSRGRHDEAVSELRRAFELDPISAAVSSDLAWVYFQARRYPEAIEQARQTLLLEPHHGAALRILWQSSVRLGRPPQEDSDLRQAIESSTLPESAKNDFLERGDFDAVWKLRIEELRAESAHKHVHPAQFALFYSYLGEAEQTLHYLKAARETPYCSYLPFLAIDPRLDPVRELEGFDELMASVERSSRPNSDLARMLTSPGE